MEWVVGLGGREGCGGSGVGVDELSGSQSSGAEGGAVMTKKIQAGLHCLPVAMVEVLQVVDAYNPGW